EIVRERLVPQSDAFVSGAYRRLLAGVLISRALARAIPEGETSQPRPQGAAVPLLSAQLARPAVSPRRPAASPPPEASPQRSAWGGGLVINGRRQIGRAHV